MTCLCCANTKWPLANQLVLAGKKSIPRLGVLWLMGVISLWLIRRHLSNMYILLQKKYNQVCEFNLLQCNLTLSLPDTCCVHRNGPRRQATVRKVGNNDAGVQTESGSCKAFNQPKDQEHEVSWL